MAGALPPRTTIQLPVVLVDYLRCDDPVAALDAIFAMSSPGRLILIGSGREGHLGLSECSRSAVSVLRVADRHVAVTISSPEFCIQADAAMTRISFPAVPDTVRTSGHVGRPLTRIATASFLPDSLIVEKQALDGVTGLVLWCQAVMMSVTMLGTLRNSLNGVYGAVSGSDVRR